MTDTKRFCRETSREEGGERNAWPAINYQPMVGINRILGMEDEGGKGEPCARIHRCERSGSVYVASKPPRPIKRTKTSKWDR